MILLQAWYFLSGEERRLAEKIEVKNQDKI
jgi:hypothetical protein